MDEDLMMDGLTSNGDVELTDEYVEAAAETWTSESEDTMVHDSECGHCERTWNSKETPTPSARCPFEYDHEYGSEDE